ncbi:MAG TPA: SRPBCC family protein [Solirubrobacterales bacterium]
MPRATRRRTIDAPRSEVWGLISDPWSLPRWWPRTMRVEGVEGDGPKREWTKVLGTAEGRGVRADFRCTESVEGERYAWEQQLVGTPFERHLRRYEVVVALQDEGEGTEVSLTAAQALRGLSRLGGPMMRRGQGTLLNEALDGIERALT